MMITIKTLMMIVVSDETITIFQAMHFREPLISEKPKLLALTHVSVYGY